MLSGNNRSYNKELWLEISNFHFFLKWNIYRITEGSGLERSSSSNLLPVGKDTSHQVRLSSTPCNLALNVSRDEAPTTSLISLHQCLTAPIANHFLISDLISPNIHRTKLRMTLSSTSRSRLRIIKRETRSILTKIQTTAEKSPGDDQMDGDPEMQWMWDRQLYHHERTGTSF